MFLKNLYHALLPFNCTLCGSFTHSQIDLCEHCESDLLKINHACIKCARPLVSPDAKLCGKCIQKPPPMDHCFALYAYQTPLTKMVMQLKFNEQLRFADMFGKLLAQHIIKNNLAYPDLIIPVPLHKKRLHQRGFNQALEIAKLLAKQLQIPLDYRNVIRKKYTQAQAQLSGVERRKNLRDAFEILKPIQAKHVVIVDDVITTMTTVSELTKCLRKYGATRIDTWCLARAIDG